MYTMASSTTQILFARWFGVVSPRLTQLQSEQKSVFYDMFIPRTLGPLDNGFGEMHEEY